MKNLILLFILFYLSLAMPALLHGQGQGPVKKPVHTFFKPNNSQDGNKYSISYTFKSYKYHESDAYFDPSLLNKSNYQTYQHKEYIENTLILFIGCNHVEKTDRYICENYRAKPETNVSIVTSDFCKVIEKANQQTSDIKSLYNASTIVNGNVIEFEEAYSINIYKEDPLKPICSISNDAFKASFEKFNEEQINKYYASQNECTCQDPN